MVCVCVCMPVCDTKIARVFLFISSYFPNYWRKLHPMWHKIILSWTVIWESKDAERESVWFSSPFICLEVESSKTIWLPLSSPLRGGVPILGEDVLGKMRSWHWEEKLQKQTLLENHHPSPSALLEYDLSLPKVIHFPQSVLPSPPLLLLRCYISPKC